MGAQNKFCLMKGLRFVGSAHARKKLSFLTSCWWVKVSPYGENRKAVMCAKQVLLSVGLRFVGSALNQSNAIQTKIFSGEFCLLLR